MPGLFLTFLKALGTALRPLAAPLTALASWAAQAALKAFKAPRGSPWHAWLLLLLVLAASILVALGAL